MTEKDLMELILGIKNDAHEEKTRKSTLQLALENARRLAGVESDGTVDGMSFDFRGNLVEYIMKDITPNVGSREADLFTSLLLYLIILEQVGTLFCNGGIQKAIKTYAPKGNRSKGYIIAQLRNSLAHNFGLVNKNNFKKESTCKFLLDWSDKTKKIVVEPSMKWDGNYSEKTPETSIGINVFPLIRLIEEILKEVKTKCFAGELKFSITDIEEIKSRFTILI